MRHRRPHGRLGNGHNLSFQIGAPRWGGVSRGWKYGRKRRKSSRVRTPAAGWSANVYQAARRGQNLKPPPTRPLTSGTFMFDIGANWTNSNSPRRKKFAVSAQSSPAPTA